jgi:hypothetical protein
MKIMTVLCLLPLAAVSLTRQSRPNPRVPGPSVGMLPAPPQVRSRVLETYGRLPLAFEANQGQTDPQVKFVSRGASYNLFLTATEAVLTLQKVSRQESNAPAATALPPQEEKSAVLHMKLLGANAKAEVFGQDELPGKSNYFIGNDPKKWHAGVRQYAKVRYANVYPGVDLVYYGNQREMEYDFVLQSGADPGAIRLGIEGARALRLKHGDLVLSSAGGDVHLRRPQIYQEAKGVRHEISGSYLIHGKNEVGFRVGSYDRSRALIIDPVLAYSTYLGGSIGDPGFGAAVDSASGVALDSAGNAYVTGNTSSTDFPTTNAIQATFGGYTDVFVTKLNADGSGLVYSTFLGGNSGDYGSGIAVDSAGNAYISGATFSTDFPTVNAIQPTFGGGSDDGFVTKINADGSALVYSTYLGGSNDDAASAIAADSAGNGYITGQTTSTDFPTVNAIQPSYRGGDGDAFVTKINAAGGVAYSTYLGSTGYDVGTGIATDSAGKVWVTGNTSSTHFPTVNALQPTYGGGNDAFVTEINAAGSALVYSTYLGGSDQDSALGIAADSAGNAYVTGYTRSTNFPTFNAIQSTYGGNQDAFVSKINAGGSAFVYSTYLGGSDYGQGQGIAADSTGNAYVTGFTSPPGSAADVFISKITPGGSALVYSKILSGSNNDAGTGIAVDSAGSAYVAGWTASKNFPVTAFAFQQSSKKQGYSDAFVAKIGETYVNVSPSNLSFIAQVVGTKSARKKVTLTNTGAGTLTIKQIYFAGPNPGDFAETNTCGSALAAGASCTISISFTPVAPGPRQAALEISDSDLGSPQTVTLSGTGTVVSLSPKRLSFGNQPVGTTSAAKSVTLTNVGNTQLNFFALMIAGKSRTDFFQTNNCGTSIAAKASCTITVTFTPTAIGTRGATVKISDDGGGSPQKVGLSGTGQ